MADQVEIRQSAQALDEVRAKLTALDEAFKKSYYTVEQYRKEHASLTKEARTLERNFISTASTITDTEKAGRRLGETTKVNALGFLYLSQAIEDAQFGFASVVNNIPGMVMMFGGGPGLAGAISIAAVGVNQLAKGFENFSRSVLATNPVPQLASDMDRLSTVARNAGARLEELKTKGSLTDSELTEFNTLSARKQSAERDLKDVSAFDSAGNRLSPSQRANIVAVQEALEQVGGPDAAIDQIMKTQNLPDTPEVRAFQKLTIGGALNRGSGADLANLKQSAIGTDFGERLQMAMEAERDKLSGKQEWMDEDAAQSLRRLQRRNERRAEDLQNQLAGDTPRFEYQYGVLNRNAEAITKEVKSRAMNMGLPEADAKTIAKGFTDNIVKGFERAVRKLAAETGMSAEEAEKHVVEDMRLAQIRARRAVRSLLTGKTLDEEEADAAALRARRADRMGGIVDDMGGGDMAAGLMNRALNDPRFLRRNRARTREEGLNAAAEFARQELERGAMLPEHMGGLGMGKEAAQRFAQESLNRAMVPMMEGLKQAALMDPQTAQERQRALNANTATMQEMISEMRRGVGIKLRPRGRS